MTDLLHTIAAIVGTKVEDGEFIRQSEQDADWIAEQRERERRDGEEARKEMPLPDDDYIRADESWYDELRRSDDKERASDINTERRLLGLE